MITEVHFKSTPARLLAMLASVDVGIDPAHATQESPSIWRVQMQGAISVPDWRHANHETTRVDFWIDDVIRSAVTGVDAQGNPIVQSVNRGRHITMRVFGPAGEQVRSRLRDAYTAPGVVTANHDTPQAILTRFNVTPRLVRTVQGCTLIHVSPPDNYEIGTGPAILQAVYSPLLVPHHRFA